MAASTSIHAPEVKIQISDYSKPVVFSHLVIESAVADHHHFSFLWSVAEFLSDVDSQSKILKFIGKGVSISFGKNKFKGIITKITIENKGDAQTFNISGQSPTILLEDAPRSTSYYKKTLKQIADNTFSELEGNMLSKEIKPK